MGTNSIKASLNKEDIVSDIKLSLAADINKELVFLVVEGYDDIRIWRRFACSDNVIIYESFSGKQGIIEIVGFFVENNRVIGIKDRDYSFMSYERIFCYDYSCMEMMLISSDENFNRIFCEYYEGELSPYELRGKLLSQLQYISIIRYYNERHKWGLNLKPISVNTAFDKNRGIIDTDNINNQINAVNNNYFTQNKEAMELVERKNRLQLQYHDLLRITQGHDFFYHLAIFCNMNLPNGSQHFSGKQIAKSARCSYTKENFQSTELYIELKRYEMNHNINIVA